MANPQIEDGYTRIQRELLDALILTDFSKAEYKVVLYVIRWTYGFRGRKTAPLSISSIVKGTKLNRRTVQRTAGNLEGRKVLILKRTQSKPVSIGIQKDFDRWTDTGARGRSVDRPLLSTRGRRGDRPRGGLGTAQGAAQGPPPEARKSVITIEETDSLCLTPGAPKESLKEREKESLLSNTTPRLHEELLGLDLGGRLSGIEKRLGSLTPEKALAYVVQAKKKSSPKAWLIAVVRSPKFSPSDEALAEAKAMLYGREERTRSQEKERAAVPIGAILPSIPHATSGR